MDKPRKGFKLVPCYVCKTRRVEVRKWASPHRARCFFCAAPPPVSDEDVAEIFKALFETDMDGVWVETRDISRRSGTVTATYVCVGRFKPANYVKVEDQTELVFEATERLAEAGKEACFRDNDGAIKIPVRIPESERRE